MKHNITLLVDERQDVLDAGLVRTIVACVELNGLLSDIQVRELIESAISEIDYTGKKLHFADMPQNEKRNTIIALSSLSFEAKVWISYDLLTNQSEAKKNAMTSALKSLLVKHSKKKVLFIIEHADEYKYLIKNKYMTGDAYVSLLPDATCYIMAMKLDTASRPSSDKVLHPIKNESYLSRFIGAIKLAIKHKRPTSAIPSIAENQAYLIQQFHEHIRLQVFSSNKIIKELARQNKL